jgi:dolichol-phosphate mannosyltransferase
MTSRARLYFVVPVLNEAANIPELISSIRGFAAEAADSFNPQLILVDDGSTDGTAERAREAASPLGLVVLAHPRSLGPGMAFATGLEYLAPRLRDDDWIVTMEGDNTSRLELLPRMLARTREGCQVVLASPYLYGGKIVNTTAWRVIVSHIANAFVKEALGMHGIVTMSSFYRLHSGQAIRRLQERYGDGIIERRGFESMIEMLMKMMALGITISEVPMVLDTSRRVGKSKMKFLRTVLGYLLLWKDRARWYRQGRGAGEA